jgi:hypothetical protein
MHYFQSFSMHIDLFEQMTVRRGSDVCQLVRYASYSDALYFAAKNAARASLQLLKARPGGGAARFALR